jgi:hypothetical protein
VRPEELIGRQQLEIEDLKRKLASAMADKHNIATHLVCIGGALNDNRLGYTKEQRHDLRAILVWAENDLPSDDS